MGKNMEIKFRPVTDRVIVRLEPKRQKTAGGIIKVETVEMPRNSGIVVGIGPEVRADIKIGDKVLFHVFDELPTYDPDVVVLRETSLLGVIEDD